MKKILIIFLLLIFSQSLFSAETLFLNSNSVSIADTTGYIRTTQASNYRHYYHGNLFSADPGAAGATWTSGSANTVCGWQLNASGETLHLAYDIHADWDGASDPILELKFALLTAGSSVGDTVDIQAIFYYEGIGDTSTKTQTVEVATTVDDSAQYTTFEASIPLNWDEGGNIIEVGDDITIIFNLETDTSEVDNILIYGASFSYQTTHIGTEAGDI